MVSGTRWGVEGCQPAKWSVVWELRKHLQAVAAISMLTTLHEAIPGENYLGVGLIYFKLHWSYIPFDFFGTYSKKSLLLLFCPPPSPRESA